MCKPFNLRFFAETELMPEVNISPIEQYVIDVVKQKREELGWSQKELAFQMDLSLGFVGDIENPNYRAKYNLRHINTLAKVFKCSPRDFLPDAPI